MGVSKNSGTPKSSISIGFSIINHPFWGTTILGNTHIYTYIISSQSIATSHEFSPQEVVKEGKPLYFREMQVGEIYYSLARYILCIEEVVDMRYMIC